MQRSICLLAILAITALASTAMAGDLIVVEEVATPTATTAINTKALDGVQRLNDGHRSILSRAIGVGCVRKARNTPELTELSQQTGNDSPKLYCDCMSDFMAQNLSLAMLKSIASTREMPPELKDAAMGRARQCMQLASR